MLLPDRISDEEQIGRSVFSLSVVKKIKKGSIPYKIFFTKTKFISVDRLFDRALSPLTQKHKIHAKSRTKKAGRLVDFHGWLCFKAHVLRQEGRQLKASPQTDNLYHADIIMPSEDRDDLIHQAKNLASKKDQHFWLEAREK